MAKLGAVIFGVSLFVLSMFTSYADGSDVIIEGYGGQPPDIDRGSSLPFSGMDLGMLIGGGVFLLCVGLLIRKIARGQT